MRDRDRLFISSRGGSRAAVLIIALTIISSLAATVLPANAATQIGFKDHSYAGFNAEASGGAITGQKPESKLWYDNGFWWAAMVSPANNGAHTIWKLGASSWQDTGVVIDTRAYSKEDVLSLGTKLYILSRSSGGGSNQVRRFTYSTGSYSLDSGFPVNVPGAGKETAVLARDSNGKLWITYTSGNQAWVVHSGASDTSWGSAFVVPVGSAASVNSDDISSVISFTDSTGPAIGVFWSNQNVATDYFAVHRDGDNDSTWTLETALTGSKEADDHMNLKTVEGRVYAVVKTSQTSAQSSLIRLLIRSETGSWTKNPVALVREGNTRPITMLQLDPVARRIYVFMSIGEGTSARGISYKSSPMDGGIGFPSSATTFIQGPNSEVINNATSMKGNADPTTGIVVLASDGNNYWWNRLGGGAPPNTAPTASAGSGSTNEDTQVSLTLSGSDPETCNLTFSIVTQPLHGTLGSISPVACASGNPNTDTAQVAYTPASNYSGSDSFTFRVNDGIADSAPATMSLTVNPLNDVPIASAGSQSTPQDTAVTVTVNGSDVETCQLTFTVVSDPTHGTAGAPGAVACVAGSPNTDSATILYTPAAGYSGSDSFTFKVNDGTADSNTATVSLTVTAPVNGVPVASAGTATTNEDTAVTVPLNGSDAETCELAFTVVTAPLHGTLGSPGIQTCVFGSPSTDSAPIQYTPAANYSGPDSFTFKVNDGTTDSTAATVSLTVTAVNDLPVAVTDSTSTAQDTPVTLTLSGTDVETCQLADFTIVTQPLHGTLGSLLNRPCVAGSPNTDSSRVDYTPDAGYAGPDSFTFTVNDGTVESNPGTFSISVVPDSNTAPTADAGSSSTNEDSATTVTISGSDAESCQLTFTVVTQPLHGTAGAPGAVACVTGSPNTDSATVLYTPAANYSGPDSFTFKVNDGSVDSPTATISLTVNAVNDLPVGSGGSASTAQDTPVTVTVNGSDVETCDLTFTVVTAPAHGTAGAPGAVACVGATSPKTDSATILYTPTSGYSGPDSFTFKVNDGTADSATTATVNITVTAVNSTPTASAGSSSTNEDTPVTVTLNGSDAESCQLTFTVVTAPLHGTAGAPSAVACVTGSPNTDSATVLYTPAANYSGPDSFTFKVNDGSVDSPTATISLTVNAVNDLPVGSGGSASTAQDTPVTVTVNGSDVETCDLTFTVVTAPAHGTAGAPGAVACVGATSPKTDSATILYTPTSGYSGADSFTFKVNDGTADSATTATVNITVNASTASIAFRSSSSAVNPTATTLVIPKPAGLVTGDVMLASVSARGNPTFTAPAGWILVRLDISGFTMRQGIWYKVATASEAASYTWTWSGAQAAAGGIVAYSGVSTSNPIDVHSGLVSPNNTTKNIIAPSVTTTVNGDMIVGFYGAAVNSTITPPAGMTERFDAVSNAGTYPVICEGADAIQATAGATGDRIATDPLNAWNIGQLVALRPSGA